MRLRNEKGIPLQIRLNIIMNCHQETVCYNASCDKHEICREFALEVREVAETARNDEDHTFDVCVHGVFNEFSLVFFQELHIKLGYL